MKLVFIVIAIALGFVAVGNSFDAHFDNQDTMLCESAKVSGNEEYLKKCQCYYAGESARCIWKNQ